MTWEEFKKMANTEDKDILDYVAVQELLRLHATGLSYKRIAMITDSDESYVLDTIVSFLGGAGNQVDLDLNPLFIYESSDTYDEFRDTCQSVSSLITDYKISDSWDCCRVYLIIKRKVEEYYEEN